MFAVFRAPGRRSVRAALIASLVVALAVGLLIAPGTTASASAAPAHSSATGRAWAHTMLAWVNGERAWHGLAPLHMNNDLIRSAHRHNLTMAAARTMSHQVRGEANFAQRIDTAGYRYVWAGENVGYNSTATLNGLRLLEHVMYNEKAPNDGHRANILSTHFRDVGIDVYFDSHGTMWFTQDFGSRS